MSSNKHTAPANDNNTCWKRSTDQVVSVESETPEVRGLLVRAVLMKDLSLFVSRLTNLACFSVCLSPFQHFLFVSGFQAPAVFGFHTSSLYVAHPSPAVMLPDLLTCFILLMVIPHCFCFWCSILQFLNPMTPTYIVGVLNKICRSDGDSVFQPHNYCCVLITSGMRHVWRFILVVKASDFVLPWI